VPEAGQTDQLERCKAAQPLPGLSLEHDAIRCAHSLSFGNSWRIRRV
jgi:hypothetical protein